MSTPAESLHRLESLAPTVISGVRWLYGIEQPHAALVRPDGLALPAVAGRRLFFVPDVGGKGPAIVVQTAGTDAGELLDSDELAGLVAVIRHCGGIECALDSPPRHPRASIRLAGSAHPSLLAAVTRYRRGCPVHRRPACGHALGPAAPCQWYTQGFSRLILPAPPTPLTPDQWGHISPPPQLSPPGSRKLDAANARRRDHGASRAIALARRAIAILERRPHRSRSSEQRLRVLRLRVENPGLSLRELAVLHEPPLTKDTYAARLRRALVAVERSGALPHGYDRVPEPAT